MSCVFLPLDQLANNNETALMSQSHIEKSINDTVIL